MSHDPDPLDFDDLVLLALAESAASGAAPRPEVRDRLMAKIAEPPAPPGFSFRYAAEADWLPHAVPGIRMKVLSFNAAAGYATLLLDVKAGTRFPPHFHEGAEECYVLAGSLHTCGRHLRAGDFVHADAGTEHGELFTDEGCQVILVTPPEDYMPRPAASRLDDR